METKDMANGMTAITRRMLIQAASGQMTVDEAVAFLEKEARPRTLREKLELYARGCDLKAALVSGLAGNHPDMSRDFFEKRVDGWLNNPAHQMLDSAEGRQTNTNKKGTSSILKRL